MDNKLLIKPTKDLLNKAGSFIKIMDQVSGSIGSNSAIVSRTTKNLKTVKAPVIRYFDSPGNISSYYSEGEYDLVAVFKLLKYESYFLKASQKKLSLLTKSGFSVVSEEDDVTEYFDKRFLVMQLMTGLSLDHIVKTLAFYLIVCSNAFLVKVRDPDFEYASSYKKDGKEMHPVVGYFLVHPTTMKPRFKYIKDTYKGQSIWKWELDEWVQTNKRGQIRTFAKEDVIHFNIFREDGMILGMPEIIPTIDDIRTLRKMEEDIQLLIYRDLFPIIHYTVDNPKSIDHTSQATELDRAKNDIQHIVQDGGIATDSRHKIQYIGNEGKSLDITDYLEHFKQRVWTGLGVSALDMSVADAGNLGSAQEASKTLIDTVKFIQQELSRQFEETILLELALQSPFDNILKDKASFPKLIFQEIDIEWKIRQENHDADLFTKGTKTVHEIRNKRGDKTLSDDDLMYTHPALFGQQPPHATMLNTSVGDEFAKLQQKIDPPKPAAGSTAKPASKSSSSGKKKDIIKSNKSNSNIVKKKAKDSINILDSTSLSLKDEFVSTMSELKNKNKSESKINIIFATKYIYSEIKDNMKNAMRQGIEDACRDLGIENTNIKIEHDLFSKLDVLRDDVADKIYRDDSYIPRAANRIAITDRTETIRAKNYGYAMACLENNINKFTVCSSVSDVSNEDDALIGSEIEIDRTNILNTIPPFHPNSNKIIKAIIPVNTNESEE